MMQVGAALRIGFCWVMAFAVCVAARAQSADPAPQLRVEAKMAQSPAQTPAQTQPPPPADAAPLTVGATSILQIDVLTSTWFTQPPKLPALDIPGALVSGPSGQATLIRTTVNGVAYSGLRFEYLVSPIAAGTLRIPAISVTAQLGQATAPVTAQARPLEVRAAGPPGNAGAMLAASGVRVTQQIQYSADPPKVGDHVSRVITIEAQGAQAMLIPPLAPPPVAGLQPYPAEPVLTQLSDSRGGFVGGQRVDKIDYVVQRAGAYELPAVDIRWWNRVSNREEHATLPATRFTAQPGAAYQAPFSVEQDLRDMGRQVQMRIPGGWLALGAALLALAAAFLVLRPACRRLWRATRTRAQAARQRWRQSEAHAALALRRELAKPQGRLDALYRWLARSRGARTLTQATADLPADLRQPASDALRDCYGAAPDAPRGFRTLRQVFPAWRRAFRVKAKEADPPPLLPLNPRALRGSGQR